MGEDELRDLQITDGLRPPRGSLPWLTRILMLLVTVALAVFAAGAPLSLWGVAFYAAAGGIIAFFCADHHTKWPLLTGAAAWALSAFAQDSLFLGMAAMGFLPLAAVLLLACVKGYSRNTAIIIGSCALGLTAACYMGLDMLQNFGTLSLSVLTRYADELLWAFRGQLALSGIPEDMLDHYLRSVLTLSPCIIICSLMGTAWLSSAVYAWLCRIFDREEKLLPQQPWRVEMSGVSAWIFAAALLMSVFGLGSQAILAAAMNILVILVPGFFLCGLRTVRRMLIDRQDVRLMVLAGVAAVATFLLNFGMFLVMIAIIGASAVITDRLHSIRWSRDE